VPTNATIRTINSTSAISTTTYERRKLLAVFPWSSYEEQQLQLSRLKKHSQQLPSGRWTSNHLAEHVPQQQKPQIPQKTTFFKALEKTQPRSVPRCPCLFRPERAVRVS